MEKEVRIIGYARVSTDDQDLGLQIAALVKYGINPAHIFKEYASGGSMNRPIWNQTLGSARDGETVVIWRLDRLGRTLTGVIQTLEEMNRKGVNLISLTEQIDTDSAMGKAFLRMALIFAELERDLISERTKAGIAVKKAQGVKFGPPHSIRDNPKRLAAYRELVESGQDETMTAPDVLAMLNAADPTARPIKHVNTLGNWRKAGLPGLE